MQTIVIAAHGCPVGSLGAYGNEFIVTTHLDRLAAEGIAYDQHFSECPEMPGARAIWWNPEKLAAFPQRILIRATRPENDAPAEAFISCRDARTSEELLRILPEVLNALAEDALLWIDCDHLLPPWNIPANLFSLYVEDLIEEEEPKVEVEDEDDEDEDEVEDEGDEDEEIDDEEPEETPAAEAIEPWSDPPTGWFDRNDIPSWELLHRSFAAALTTFDAELGRLFDLFRERGLDRTATWAFTGSFGYPLGEHGLLGPHRAWLYEELVHVPMIVRLPGGVEAGLRIPGFTQHADFWEMLSPSFVPRRECAISQWAKGESAEAAIRTEAKALLLPLRVPEEDEPRPPELYEKPGDRWEANNVQPRQVETADELEAGLRKQL